MGKMKTLGEDLKEKLEQATMDDLAQRYTKALAQNMVHTKNTFTANILKPHKSKVDDPNTREAYVIPLSRLVNLWRAKFGDVWVDVSELEDEFWMDASARLHRNKLMEEIEFRESNTPWARLKEDA